MADSIAASSRDIVDAYKVNSLIMRPGVDPRPGKVYWDPARSVWNGCMLVGAIVLGPLYFSVSAFILFLITFEATMCFGHSVGFHRRLIHRTFECPKWLERILVWLGVLVGMQGPFWVIRSHDVRDWAQRQPQCHPFICHGRNLWVDGWWNLHCRLELDYPPGFDSGPGIGDDKFYNFLQKTWMAQQIPIAVLFYLIGGWPWVVWGVIVRIAVGVHMHWYVGYLCHTRGGQDWLVDDGAVQAHNVRWAAIPSMGESWHNNHHAFPASARHGIYPGQFDPGFRFIQLLELFGLAWNVKTPDILPARSGITPITPRAKATLSYQKQKSAIVKRRHQIRTWS